MKDETMLSPHAHTNSTELTPGTVLIQEGLLLPELLTIETSPYSQGWRVVTTSSKALGERIGAVDWNYFFTAGNVEGSAFGRLLPMNLRRALRQILQQVQKRHFNAVEIGSIKRHKALGLFPYVTMSAHARHIQKSEQLDSDSQRKTAQAQSAWAAG